MLSTGVIILRWEHCSRRRFSLCIAYRDKDSVRVVFAPSQHLDKLLLTRLSRTVGNPRPKIVMPNIRR